jgi:tetratricopeptide (TPR) repeat protein
VAQALGAPWVITTEVSRAIDGYRFASTVYHLGEAAGREEVLAEDLLAGARLLSRALALRFSPSATVDLREAFSSDTLANLSYATGLARLQQSGPGAAEPYLRVAVDRDPDFLRARLELAAIRFRVGESEEARRMLEEAREQAIARGDADLQASVANELARLALSLGDYQQGERWLGEVLELERRSPGGPRAGTLYTLGTLHYRRGAHAEAEQALEQSIAGARADGQRELEAASSSLLGWISQRRGELAEAEARFESALAIVRDLGSREQEAGMLLNLATLALQRQDAEGAARYCTSALETFRALEHVKGQLVAHINLGAALLQLGDLTGAEARTADALALARRLEDRRSESFALSALGYFESKRGALEAAETHLAEAERIASAIGDVELDWQNARNGAYLRIRQGRLTEAARRLERALAIRRDSLTVLVEARLAYARGDFAGAVRLQEEVRSLPAPSWSPLREGVLASYRESLKRGTPLPLPDEGRSQE